MLLKFSAHGNLALRQLHGKTKLQTTHFNRSQSYRYLRLNHTNRFVPIDNNTTRQFQQISYYSSGVKRRSIKVEPTPLEDRFNMEWPKITLYGDSITRRSVDTDNGCWGSMIAYKAGTYFDVDERGFEGYNSKWALELMPQLFPKSYLDKVELFVLFFGHNDSWDNFPAHVPVEQYESNIRAIIKYLEEKSVEKRKIILITPTWYHDESFKRFLAESGLPPFGKKLDIARKYGEAVLRIAKDNNIDVVDFFATSLKQEPLEKMFCDGVHFSREGAKLLFNQLMPVIERKIQAAFNKPLADLWHVIPFDQRPEIKAVLEQYQISLKTKS